MSRHGVVDRSLANRCLIPDRAPQYCGGIDLWCASAITAFMQWEIQGAVTFMSEIIQYSVSGDLHSDELGCLLYSASHSTYSANELEHVVSGSTTYVTARASGMLVGFGRMLSDGAVLAYINNMAVRPDYQRQGIGQAILKALIEAAGEVKSIFLYSNTADSFYLRNGFQGSDKRLYVLRAP